MSLGGVSVAAILARRQALADSGDFHDTSEVVRRAVVRDFQKARARSGFDSYLLANDAGAPISEVIARARSGLRRSYSARMRSSNAIRSASGVAAKPSNA